MTNALATESSPYLRQHAENPVDWLAWGEAALGRARDLNRPLLVSIGYAACHWCHVMAHESFEDPAVAALMNASFVCVKVDREERPDVDAVCMEACQRMTGQGGWPLNVFLTPEGEPFFAGTYFPPEPRHGLAAWPAVVSAVADAWEHRPEAVREQATQLTAAILASAHPLPVGEPVAPGALADAVNTLAQGFDRRWGGWGSAPKFPPHGTLEFLLARAAGPGPDAATAGEMALGTLEAMAAGGIFDQVGGGFHRYAVDGTWTVPHFEKMLYDNAMLARAYLRGYQLSGSARLRDVCESTLDFCVRELQRPDGGFASALDADSDGVEGSFYVWTPEELHAALGGDPELYGAAVAFFGAADAGNFEGSNVLEGRGPVPDRLGEIRARLLEVRGRRVRPGIDDKRVCAWNALMIGALADAGTVLERPDLLAAATGCAEALLADAWDPADGPDGLRLMRTGVVPAFLDDLAYLTEALVTLYEATWEARWYTAAVRVADAMIARFADPVAGGFYTTPAGHADLVARRRDLEDAPIPSGSSAAAYGLLRLARLAGSNEYERRALGVLAAHGPVAVRHPTALGHLLLALDFHLGLDVREVAVVGEPPDGPLAKVVRSRYRPHVVLAGARDPAGGAEPAGTGSSAGSAGIGGSGGIEGSVPLLEHRGRLNGAAAVYVCERFACQAPASDPPALRALLGDG